jgi:hypothetical protein
MRLHPAVAFAVLLVSAGCTGDPAVTTPAATSTSSSPYVFTSEISVGGAATHSITVATAGVVNLTLTSVTPSARVGLGVGVTGGTAFTCSLSRSVDAVPTADSTPQLSVTVDPGDYCVQVYDDGGLTSGFAQFSVTIDHP